MKQADYFAKRIRSFRPIFTVAAALSLLLCAGWGQGGTLPLAQAKKVETLKIDGNLSAAEWGEPVFRFGEKPESGLLFLTWKPEGLAVAFTATDLSPVYGGFPEGTSLHRGDLFEVFVDPVGDHRQYYEVQVDPSGRVHVHNHVLSSAPEVLKSLRFTESFVKREKWSHPLPRPVGMEVASSLDTEGRWTLELLLPASDFLGRRLGKKTMEPMTLRMNFCRIDTRKDGSQEVLVWSLVEPGCQHISPQAMGRTELVK